MKAVMYTRYGPPDVLQVREVDKPVPQANELLVAVHASSVTAADSMMRQGKPFYGRLFLGLAGPKHPIPGTGFAGIVEAVGDRVTRFKPGDAVLGESTFGPGANAEYLCVAEDGVVAAMPASLSFPEAAPLCDGALTSWAFLKDLGHVQPGQRVLINGASGSLGTAAVQIAKHLGAEVTGVCSARNVALVKSLGADHVIDYTRQDFTASGQTYHVIFDTVGKRSFSRCKGSLTEQGVYLSPVLGLRLLLQMLWTARFSSKKAMFSATGLRAAPELRDFLAELVELIEAGALKSVTDRRYPLEAAADAHRYVDQGHKRGNVVLAMAARQSRLHPIHS